MKSLPAELRMVFLSIGLIFFFNMQGWGADWKGFAETDNASFYYDADTVTRPSKGVIRVWEKRVYKPKAINDMVEKHGATVWILHHSLILSEVHCAEKKRRLMSIDYYSKDGGFLSSRSISENDWTFMVPESIGESIYKVLCK